MDKNWHKMRDGLPGRLKVNKEKRFSISNTNMDIFKKGSRGETVKLIQKALNLYPDGVFGPLTEERVKQFQKDHNLTADGIVGPKTLALLIPSVASTALKLKKSKRRIDWIVVHCTATPEGKDMTVEQIRKEHINNRGFKDIGYHYVIYRDGSIHNGRDVDVSGAHVTGYNSYSIGIVYVGGLEEQKPGVAYNKLKAKDTRTEAQKAALLSLLVDLKKLYPKAKIQGHRDFSPDKNHNGTVEPSEWIKACPCFDAKSEYRRLD